MSARQDVRRHLDTVVVEAGNAGEQVRERRLRDARNALEEDVTSREQRDREVFDRRFVTDQHSAHLFADGVVDTLGIRIAHGTAVDGVVAVH